MRPQLETVEEIFHAALDCESGRLGALLNQRCAGDEALRRQVEQLLAAHRQAGNFIQTPVATVPASIVDDEETNLLIGQTIGHYRILKRISAGGMGAVYLAERADQQFEKQVAIKLIKRGMDTDSVLHHFRNERQILASFDHPNIARLLDGGATESGLPYFVMEYVEGLPIDQYCEKHALSIAERLKLFREVCAAVSYAHHHTVIHRDIKPSNILVAGESTPKLLDFGIAKLLQPGAGMEPFATMTGVRLMTPEYASPEQVRGDPVTTATDVYSLGVVLYQLLTGQKPYRLKTRTPEEISRAIIEQEPQRPSTAVAKVEGSSKALSANPRLLRGDLDNIVLVALRKEPERRYQSVGRFSEDIQRHLQALPVRARKDTLAYRSAKFVRRNKGATAAAALVVLTLLGGIVATTWEAHRAKAEKALAERRFNDVRQLAHSVLFDYHDAIKSLAGSTKIRERLVKDALNYLDRLATEAHGDPALQRELAAGYERVGDVRGGLREANLGDIAGATDSYNKALRIREALVALKPSDAQARRELASAYSDLGVCLMRTEANVSVTNLKKARALFLDLTREQPENEDFLNDLVGTSGALAATLVRAGDLEGALEQYRAAASLSEKLVAKKPHDKKFRLSQLIAERSFALALWQQQGDEATASAVIDKALGLIQALIAEDPANTNYQTGLFHLNNDAGRLRAETDPGAALGYFRRAAEVQEKLLKADPANSEAEVRVADIYMDIARALSRQGDVSEALSYYSKSAEYFGKLSAAATSPNWGLALRAVTAGAGAAAMHARSGGGDLALRECSELTAHLGEIPDDPTNTQYRLARAETYEYLGYAYRDVAAASTATASDSKQYTSVARDLFRQSKNIFEDVRTRGGLTIPDTKEAESVAEEMAKCEKALDR